jgi:hypothetical protein
MSRYGRLAAVAALLTLVAACPNSRLFCATDHNCLGDPPHDHDRCFFNGRTGSYCALPDSTCPSLYRWDIFAGSLSGSCVDPAVIPDAGVDGSGVAVGHSS